MKLKNVEFYWNSIKEILMCENLNDGKVVPFKDLPLGDIINLDLEIKRIYPETHAALCAKFGDRKDCSYSRVYQFICCNYSDHDGQPDIDDDYNFNLEKVSCPIRHLCKDNFCHPVMDRILTRREYEVIDLFIKGMDLAEIGQRLFISDSTVHNHINNIYSKLGLVGKTHPDRLLMSMYYEKKI